jgi:hypothetical protein
MNTKNVILKIIRKDAISRMGRLSCELARARSEEKEAILAEMDYQRWLTGCIHDGLTGM